MKIKVGIYTTEAFLSDDRINGRRIYKTTSNNRTVEYTEDEILELISMKIALEEGIDSLKKIDLSIDEITV